MTSNKKSISSSVSYEAIVRALESSVKRNPADGLLLSGGLDTSILACLAAKWSKPYCVTIALKGAPAPDIEYAKKIAALFKLEHCIHYFGHEELEEGIRGAITVLKSFDPMEIRNSAAAYVALKVAGDRGLKTVMTGDGGDELFAGYSFFFDLSKEQLDSALTNMWSNMQFSSIELAGSLGIAAKLPILDPEFKALAMSLDSSLKVKSENGRVFGKWILRKAFEKFLSPEIVWRVKAPLEVGSGTTTLPALFDSRISDSEFNLKKELCFKDDRVKIRSKEHLLYYEIYKNIIGIPGSNVGEGRKCSDCGANVKEKINYCPTCGAYPLSL